MFFFFSFLTRYPGVLCVSWQPRCFFFCAAYGLALSPETQASWETRHKTSHSLFSNLSSPSKSSDSKQRGRAKQEEAGGNDVALVSCMWLFSSFQILWWHKRYRCTINCSFVKQDIVMFSTFFQLHQQNINSCFRRNAQNVWLKMDKLVMVIDHNLWLLEIMTNYNLSLQILI